MLVFDKMDQIYLSISVDSYNYGLYAFSGSFVIIVISVVMSISNVLTPYLFDNEGETSVQYVKYSLYVQALFYLAIPFYFIVKSVVSSYYLKYIDSIEIFSIMLISSLISSITYIIHKNFYFYLGEHRAYMKHNSFFAFILLATLYVYDLTYTLDIYSAASITLLSTFLRFCSSEIYLSRIIKRKPNLTIIALVINILFIKQVISIW